MIAEPVRKTHKPLGEDYFRIRDFEYAQPLYDLAFLLEVDALRAGTEIPKYRIFSLWKAAYRMDGYTTSIDRWLDGKLRDKELDIVPSSRIKQYLQSIRTTGTLPELQAFDTENARRILRLRAVRGLGASKIAEFFRQDSSEKPTANGDASSESGYDVGLGNGSGTTCRVDETAEWQAAHVVPPLLRFLHQIEKSSGRCRWKIDGFKNGIQRVNSGFVVWLVTTNKTFSIRSVLESTIAAQPFFSILNQSESQATLQHQLGWSFALQLSEPTQSASEIASLIRRLDPMSRRRSPVIRGDLHVHTIWSDGNSDIANMAAAVKKARREYFAITDHSRSCKLQGGLTPVAWLRQAISLLVTKLPCRVLHGIEVDILADGRLDLPAGLLAAMDFVIGSVHGSWSESTEENTLRLVRAIESGCIDVIGHPTSAIIGKPGVPNYARPAAPVDWKRIFQHCAQWRVALELNCFPSRLDLALPALRKAVDLGCWISLGSDAHSRSHLTHLRLGESIIKGSRSSKILNRFSFDELRQWLSEARTIRTTLPKTGGELFAADAVSPKSSNLKIVGHLNRIQSLPPGSRVVGLDLTAGRGKPSGVALLERNEIETLSLITDDEILEYLRRTLPKYVSIDSPLGLPGGGQEIDPAAGIVRMAERDLANIGIPAYPAMIDSMRELTLRGIALKQRINSLPDQPVVLESYPGAAQDVLCIPRKQKSLESLRTGLSELGLVGPGLKTRSHDEMDAITAAVVGRYFEVGEFEPMGIASEAQLIVPKVRPLTLEPPPVICLAGKMAAGKSTVARYLSVFYGFRWIRTRDLIRAVIIDDLSAPAHKRMFKRAVQEDVITEQDLTDFGIIILEQYHQIPLRAKLNEVISANRTPVVVDSIRDVIDVDSDRLRSRVVETWFVDATDSRRIQRLGERQSAGGSMIVVDSRIDQKVNLIRAHADKVIPNVGTLEELRWKIDDALFESVQITSPYDSTVSRGF
jgi:histidinol phosphatase-like PHP family hydrolase/predicted nuclease with RNAse H fold/dephospho-CoA kinase